MISSGKLPNQDLSKVVAMAAVQCHSGGFIALPSFVCFSPPARTVLQSLFRKEVPFSRQFDSILCCLYLSQAFILGIHCILLFFLSSLYRPGQRTADDLEFIYEELLHIKALSHLSTTVSIFKNVPSHQQEDWVLFSGALLELSYLWPLQFILSMQSSYSHLWGLSKCHEDIGCLLDIRCNSLHVFLFSPHPAHLAQVPPSGTIYEFKLRFI